MEVSTNQNLSVCIEVSYIIHPQHIKFDERKSPVGSELKQCDTNAYISSDILQNVLLIQ
jgi:hypothetical protein